MTITIAHTKGGVGKSTLCWNLALAWWIKNLGTVSVADLDFQQTIYLTSKIREDLGEESVGRFEVTTPKSQAELASLYPRNDKDVLFIDIGGFDSKLNRQAMAMADLIIVPISISLTEVLGFKTFEAILHEERIDKSKIRIVLNNINPLVKNFDIIREALGEYQHFRAVIHRRSAYLESIGAGLCVLESKKWSKANDEITHLLEEIYDYETQYIKNK